MATDQTFADGHGSQKGSLGWELPRSAWAHGRLTEGQYRDSEREHVLFRAFHPPKDADPLQSMYTMSELLHRWLRPDVRTIKQIMDQLVLEKFMTCMPLELQVLVKERRVQSCEELEFLLINKEKPRKWTVLTFEGHEYLQENSHEEDGYTNLKIDLSLKSLSPISSVGAHPENSPDVLGEPENQPGPSDVVWGQRQKVLLSGTIPNDSDPQCVRPMWEVEELKDVMEDGEEAAVLPSPEPSLPSTPGDSLRTEVEQNPQEGIGLDHVDDAEVLGEPEDQPGPSDVVWGQGQEVLLSETIPKEIDLQGERPMEELEELENDVMEEGEEAAVLPSPEPLLPSTPGDSLRRDGEQNPQEGIGLDHVDATEEPPTHFPVSQALRPRRKRKGSPNPRGAPKRTRGDIATSQEEPQETAVPLDNGEVTGQHGSNSAGAPNTVEPTGQPVGKESRRRILLECQDCSKRFSYQSQLALHRRSHTGERPFQCPQCPRGFIQASDLAVHLRIHTGEKPFRCTICKKRFTHESTLRGHQRVHTQEKPYQCEVCQKSFSHRGNLNVHMRTHSGLRPYQCPQCGRAFRQLGTFKRHQSVCRGAAPRRPQVPSVPEAHKPVTSGA